MMTSSENADWLKTYISRSFDTLCVCAQLEAVEESGIEVRRPNSMNNYGVVVNEIGMENFMDKLMNDVTQPIATALFPLQGRWIDSHHSFSVTHTDPLLIFMGTKTQPTMPL